MTDRPASDVLSELVAIFDLRAHVYATPRTCGLWHMEMAASTYAEFHLVARGTCYVHLGGAISGPRLLQTGDVIVFPRGLGHALSASPDKPAPGTQLLEAAPGEGTHLVCGTLAIAGAHGNPLMASLDDVVIIGDADVRDDIAALAVLMASEARLEDRAARQMVLDRLSEVLFIFVLRHELQRGAIRGGLISALADARLRRVLMAIHEAPGTAWSIARLARVASLSRTALAARFSASMGVPPMQYLAGLRMQLATRWLRGGTRSVADVASELGYGSEAGFRRAFKRVLGTGARAGRRQVASR